MGKTRNLFKKIGNIKGTFHPKMDTMKDKNGRNLVDTEEIKKRWKEYMEELYKKGTNEQGYHAVVVSHPEPDILEYKVKWALRSTAINKASGCDEIPAELFRSLKNDAIKVLHLLLSANLEDTAVATGLEKVNPHPNPQEKLVAQVMSNSLRYHGQQHAPLLCPWNFPGKSTGVGCHFFLCGISPTRGLNRGLLHCRRILYKLTHQGNDPQEG